MRNAAVRKTYQACTAPQMRNDPHLSPQLILGMEWYSATELLQVCCSVYVLESSQYSFSSCVI